jgi:hypothetical protein
MKIKSQEDLGDYLDNEIAWRKRELSTLKSNVEKSRDKLEGTAIRSGILLLYAHWEGFFKRAAEGYLEYVISKRLKYKALAHNFIAIALKQQLETFEQTNKATVHHQLIAFLFENQDERAHIRKDNVIKTQSNLNSVILKEMMTAIGLDFAPYETKSKLIDEQLLNYRNSVAHGEHQDVDKAEYLVLHEEVRKMMDHFKTDIQNAALMARFQKKI